MVDNKYYKRISRATIPEKKISNLGLVGLLLAGSVMCGAAVYGLDKGVDYVAREIPKIMYNVWGRYM